MLNFLMNWKTTIAGLGAVLTAGGHLLTAIGHGDTSTIATDLPVIMAGIGLLLAKDGAAK